MSNELATTNNRDLAEAITEAQRQILTQRTPSDVIRHRPGPGGRQLAYVEHAWVTRTLNEAFQWRWSWEVLEFRLLPSDQEPTEVFVLGRLTIHTPNGDLVKQQFGSSAVKCDKRGKPLSIGDDLKSASSDALKKAASLLGLALDLYGSEPQQPTNGKPKSNEPAKWAHSASIVARMMAEAEKRFGLSQSDVLLALLVDDPRDFTGTKSEAWKMIEDYAARRTDYDIPL